ncbi:MAG: response regulator [Thermodesulfobacteriota bacterium]
MDRKNILIVDRDKEFLRYLREELQPYDNLYQTAFTTTTTKAETILQKFPVNLVLANIHLAGESGIDLLLTIRRRFSNTRVVLYGAEFPEELKRAAYYSGVAAVLNDPFTIIELLKVLSTLFSKDSEETFFESLQLPDLLQLIGMGNHSTDIHLVDQQNQPGTIRIRQGRLLEAEAAGRHGVDAVTYMLSLKNPTIETVKVDSSQIENPSGERLTDVLLRAVTQLDER